MQSNPFETHPQQRRPFIFAAEDPGNRSHAAKNDPAERQARAAEYIAMYLDRIELQLDRIGVALESGDANEKLRKEVSAIAHMLPALLRKP